VRIVEDQLDVSFVDEEQWWSWKWSFSQRGLLEQMEAADLNSSGRKRSPG
jgi:hypothetical protein